MSDSTITAYRFGAFELDVRAFRLQRDGRRVRLERRPMDLLLLFLTRRGELITRQEIAASLWPADVFVDVETGVNTVIWKLRTALKDSSETPRFIETVPGRGYRFVAPVEVTQEEPAPPPATEEPLPLQSGTTVVEEDVPRTTAPTRRSWLRPAAGWIAAAGALLAVAIWAWYPAPAPSQPVRIGVLPITSLGGDHERAYLAEGLTEEISASLGQVTPDRLIVIGTRSMLAYRGSTQPARQIGRELGLDYLVEGSLHVEGDRVRLIARLVRVEDESQVWTQRYEENLSTLLTLQQRLSAAVANQVITTLQPSEAHALVRRQTMDPVAYDLYLAGRAQFQKATPAANRQAVEFFQRATARDPGYALAWAGLADVHAAMPINSDVPPLSVAEAAREASRRAIAADPRLAEALFSQGFVHFYFNWDWGAAEASFRRALVANPALPAAYRMLGHTLSQMGRHSEARAMMLRATELDPLDPINHALAAQAAYQARDYEAALEYARRTITLAPGFWIGYVQLAQASVHLDRFEDALEALDNAARHSGDNSKTYALRGYVLARSGQADQARAVLSTLEGLARDRFVPPYSMALIHAGLGDADAAFAWLEKAYAVRDVHLMFLTVDPKWDPYRRDPRFDALIARCDFLT